MSKRIRQDIGACMVIYMFCIFAYVQTLTMQNGADVMPLMVLSIAGICNTVLLVRTILQIKHSGAENGYIDWSEIKVPLLMFFGVVAYSLLVSFSNYFVGTAVMLFLFMMIEKVKPIWKVVVIDLVYLAFIYTLFIVVLKVPLL